MAENNNVQKRFEWNENSTHRPYQYRPGTKETARSWDALVEILKGDNYKERKFQAKPKSMQDLLKTVTENRKSQVVSQEKQSGTVVEGREIDLFID